MIGKSFKNLGLPKKFVPKNIFGPEKILGPKKVLGQKNFGSKRKFIVDFGGILLVLLVAWLIWTPNPLNSAKSP